MHELPRMLLLLAAHPALSNIHAASVVASGLAHHFLPDYSAFLRCAAGGTVEQLAPDAATQPPAGSAAAKARSLARMHIRSWPLSDVPSGPLCV